MNFLSAPSISTLFDVDLPISNLNLAEEEENHSSSKKKTNPPQEEETHYFLSFRTPSIFSENSRGNYFIIQSENTIKDDLVLKIPDPPPEFV